MGISCILEAIDGDSKALVEEFIKKPKKVLEYLHLPYSDHLDYWRNRSEMPQVELKRNDMDKSFDPIMYLITGKSMNDVGDDDSLEIRLVQSTKFYKVQVSGIKVTFTYGKVHTSGKGDSNYTSSHAEALEMGLKKLETKISEGYKIDLEFESKVIKEKVVHKKETEEKEEGKEEKKTYGLRERKPRVIVEKPKKRKNEEETKSSKKQKQEEEKKEETKEEEKEAPHVPKRVNLSKLSLKDIELELQARNLTPKSNSIEKMLQLAMHLLKESKPKKFYSEFLLIGGHELKELENDFAYGAPRIINSEQVNLWYQEIKDISETDLKKRYNPKLMDKKAIGPPFFYQDEQETWDYLLLHFKQLNNFLEHHSKKENAIIIYLS